MRRKRPSSAAALAGFVSTLLLGTTIAAEAANASAERPSSASERNTVRQPLFNSGSKKLIAYAPPAAAAAGGDYLQAVSQNGMHRWAAERMPLKVYIEEGVGVPGYRSSMKQLLVKSFDEWCRISDGKLSWREVSSPSQADIACNYSDTPRKAGPHGFEAGVTNTIIQQNRYTGQSSIARATMTILTQWRGRQFSDSEIYMTELHEVGHAMGMQGHSNVASDLMYSTVNRQQSPVLTQRDANTIEKLYRNYGTEPTIAFGPRRSTGGYPQMAPPTRNFGDGYGAAGGFNSGYGNAGGDAAYSDGAFGNRAPRDAGASSGGGSRVVEADGLQPFTPVEAQGGGYRGGNRWNDLSDAEQGGSGVPFQGFGQGGFRQGGPGFGASGGPGRQDPGFGQGGPGQGWRSHRRARWRNLDPAQRAAMRQRMQQMQDQGLMPDGGFGGGMPDPGFGGMSGWRGMPTGADFGGMPGPDFGGQGDLSGSRSPSNGLGQGSLIDRLLGL